jgi:hypothetical protein
MGNTKRESHLPGSTHKTLRGSHGARQAGIAAQLGQSKMLRQRGGDWFLTSVPPLHSVLHSDPRSVPRSTILLGQRVQRVQRIQRIQRILGQVAVRFGVETVLPSDRDGHGVGARGGGQGTGVAAEAYLGNSRRRRQKENKE